MQFCGFGFAGGDFSGGALSGGVLSGGALSGGGGGLVAALVVAVVIARQWRRCDARHSAWPLPEHRRASESAKRQTVRQPCKQASQPLFSVGEAGRVSQAPQGAAMP